eukprot:Sspe_Gene.72135::Locus_42950_Transcript_1_1_Confidence_1.000_Length_2047::g.72135::m.72135/K07304/msrA; peptide-methionine (S)-S-oxide reductase
MKLLAITLAWITAVHADTVVLGMGCFFRGKKVFEEQVPGVKVRMGYSGGFAENPTYEDVMRGRTGHAEVVEITYDTGAQLKAILDVFWKSHNPTQFNRQGNLVGSQYRSVAYFASPEQNQTIHETKSVHEKRLQADGVTGPIVTQVAQLEKFFPAEGNIAEIASAIQEKVKKDQAEYTEKLRQAEELRKGQQADEEEEKGQASKANVDEVKEDQEDRKSRVRQLAEEGERLEENEKEEKLKEVGNQE